MSREFGEYGNCGYFHTKISAAMEDCETGTHPVTALMGDLLKPLADLAYAIASTEACDSGAERPIVVLRETLPQIQAAVDAMAEYIRPFDAVVSDALRKAVHEVTT